MKIKLVNIDPTEVEADIEKQYASRAHAQDIVTARFNTSFHALSEAPDLPDRPSEEPYSFQRWLPLILRSRGLSSGDAQVVEFSRAQTRTLLDAANASIPSGRINRVYEEDVQEEILPAFRALTFPAEGLFMRLEACSAKDGVRKVPGTAALSSVEDILLLLLTSVRARNAISKSLEGDSKSLKLFFIPFNPRMQSAREYRVFCPPFRDTSAIRISAISQYRWHKPWLIAEDPDLRKDMKGHLEKIARGCEITKNEIAEELDSEENEMDALLMRQGFTFDVFFDEESGASQLIELNVFGVRSACGSCLFNWVADREVLEGRGGSEDVEVRVSSSPTLSVE